jgi:hypothetical protein
MNRASVFVLCSTLFLMLVLGYACTSEQPAVSTADALAAQPWVVAEARVPDDVPLSDTDTVPTMPDSAQLAAIMADTMQAALYQDMLARRAALRREAEQGAVNTEMVFSPDGTYRMTNGGQEIDNGQWVLVQDSILVLNHTGERAYSFKIRLRPAEVQARSSAGTVFRFMSDVDTTRVYNYLTVKPVQLPS